MAAHQVIISVPRRLRFLISTSYLNSVSRHGSVFVSSQEHGGPPSRLFKQLPDVMHLLLPCSLGVLRVPRAPTAMHCVMRGLSANPFENDPDVKRSTSRSPSRQCSGLTWTYPAAWNRRRGAKSPFGQLKGAMGSIII